MKLDKAAVATLALPPGVNDKTFWDSDIGGFGVRMREGGAARYVVQYDIGQKTRRMTLGSVAALDLGAARKSAKDILAGVRLGRDPASAKIEARERAGETFGTLLVAYLAHKRAQLRARSFKETERHLTKYARSLYAYPVASIDRRSVAALMTAITAKNGPAAANCMLGSLSGYFNWLTREGLIDRNPASYVNKAVANKGRDRLISDDELRALWRALDDSDYSDVVRLLIYTAARRNEIGDLRWDEIDLDKAVIEIPASRMKNDKPHVIPLSESALAILRKREQSGRDFVFGEGARGFQGWSWRRRDLDARIAGPRSTWVLHDFRRLASTVMHEQLGIPPHVVEAVLAHVGHRAGVAGTYNKASYIDEKRRALTAWARYVDTVTTGKTAPGKVVKLRA